MDGDHSDYHRLALPFWPNRKRRYQKHYWTYLGGETNMKSALSQQFIVAFALIVLAIPLSMMGAVILALPMGLVGGFFLLKEMINKFNQ
jgi:hypothetical protein